MKTNLFSKVAVTMMTVALGAGVVGSISGTVAWFQYSTRSTVAFTGTSAHCTENLQIRLVKDGQGDEEGWKSDLPASEIADVLKGVSGKYQSPEKKPDPSTELVDPVDVNVDLEKFYTKFPHGGEAKFVFGKDSKWHLGNEIVSDADMDAVYGIDLSTISPVENGYIRVIANAIDTVRPVTSSTLAKGKTPVDLYRNPIYQYPHMESWQKAQASDFVTIPLELRVKDVNGAASVSTLAKNIYVSKMDMAVEEVANKGDITPALRVAISAAGDGATEFTPYGTFSTKGTDVETYGKLDLNNDKTNENPGLDTYGDFDWEKGPEILYGYEHGDITISVTNGTKVASATVEDDWFVGKYGVGTGEVKFRYVDGQSSWTLVGPGTQVKLSEYGIKVTYKSGETAPANNDELTVTIPAVAEGSNVAKSYGLSPVATATGGIADDSDPYNIIGTPIGSTGEDGKTLRVNLKIYLEGWQKLGEEPGSALWDAATYIGSKFNVGVRFSADAHTDH